MNLVWIVSLLDLIGSPQNFEFRLKKQELKRFNDLPKKIKKKGKMTIVKWVTFKSVCEFFSVNVFVMFHIDLYWKKRHTCTTKKTQSIIKLEQKRVLFFFIQKHKKNDEWKKKKKGNISKEIHKRPSKKFLIQGQEVELKAMTQLAGWDGAEIQINKSIIIIICILLFTKFLN